jgi:hypothetical protein
VGVHFVKATYSLEGDGLLVLKCYEEISKIRAVITSECYPNLQAAVRNAVIQPHNTIGLFMPKTVSNRE